MKNLKSNLFKQFELNKSDLSTLVGGSYTTACSDTNVSGRGNDRLVGTCIDGGEQLDSVMTNMPGETTDKPVGTCETLQSANIIG